MKVAKVTAKGQVTIPKAVREVLGIEQGDFLVFVPSPAGHVEVRRLPGRTLSQLHGVLRIGRSTSHTDERKRYRRRLAGRLRDSPAAK